MNRPGSAEFEAQAGTAGVDALLERRCAPDAVIASRGHAVAVDALVTHDPTGLIRAGRMASSSRHRRPCGTRSLA